MRVCHDMLVAFDRPSVIRARIGADDLVIQSYVSRARNEVFYSWI